MFVHGINGHYLRSWTSGAPHLTPTELVANTNKVPKDREPTERLVLPNAERDHSCDIIDSIDMEDAVLTSPKLGTYYVNDFADSETGEKHGDGEVEEESKESKEGSGQEGGVLWARDFLPAKLPRAHILTCCYSCTTNSTGLELMSRSWIEHTARALLKMLITGRVGVGPEDNTDAFEDNKYEQSAATGEGCDDSGASIDKKEEDGKTRSADDGEEQDNEDAAKNGVENNSEISSQDSCRRDYGGNEADESRSVGEGKSQRDEGTETVSKVKFVYASEVYCY